tara:strand:- start:1593 stop:2096 length:504 start_codon:yes stop_codon:yes gene_type:complete
MIQSQIKANFDVRINTEANRIVSDSLLPPTIPNGCIKYLTKFTNDMSGDIVYCYANPQNFIARYSFFGFTYSATPDMYAGELDLKLAGYWKYEFYEVYWSDCPAVLDSSTAPRDEFPIEPPLPSGMGEVKGLVAIGKMYCAEEAGKPEVEYKSYKQPSSTNYIYQGK